MHTSIMVKRLAFLLLWASAAFGQQVGTPIPWQTAQTVSTITVTPKAGDTLVMYGYFGNAPTITDSTGNLWSAPNTDYNGIQLSGCTLGGTETITVRFTVPSYLRVLIFEFAGCYDSTHPDVIPPRSPTNGAQSLQYQDDTATPCSFPLKATTPNELILAYDDSGDLPNFSLSQVTLAPGWQMAGLLANRMMEYTIQATPGIVTGCFTQPFIVEGSGYATIGIVGLKLLNPPTFQSVSMPMHLRYCTLCDGTDDTSTGLNILTGLQVQVYQSQTSSGTFVLNSTGDVTAKVGLDITQNPIVLNFVFLTPTGSILPQCQPAISPNYPAPPNMCLQIAFDSATLGSFSTVNGQQFWNANWSTLNMFLLLDSKNAAPRGSRSWTSP